MPLEALMNPSVSSQLQQALALLQRHLGGNLLAVHLFGSAVVGGLKPGSDLDLLVTVAAPLPKDTRHSLMRELLMISAWPANERMRPLEVTWVVHHSVRPWRYPAMRELQFGEWLRADIEAGRIEPPQQDHDLAILLHQTRKNGLCLIGPGAAELFDPVPEEDMRQALRDTLAQWREPADWQGDECNVVLAVARAWLTLTTDAIAPKDVAAIWLLERLPDEHRAVLEKASQAYRGDAIKKPALNPQAVEAFIRHAQTRLQPSQPTGAER